MGELLKRASIAANLGLAGALLLSACSESPQDGKKSETSASRPSDLRSTSKIGACGINGVQVILKANEATPSAAACEFGKKTRDEFAKGKDGRLTVSESTGWYLFEDRSACIAYPVIGQEGDQGFIAYAAPQPNGEPLVTVDPLSRGPLPETTTQTVSSIPYGDRYVAIGFAGSESPVLGIAERREGDCNK